MNLQPGQMLSHYRVVEKIGEGGMGEVYRAEDTRLGREVALKLLPADVALDQERRSRFEREASTALPRARPSKRSDLHSRHADSLTEEVAGRKYEDADDHPGAHLHVTDLVHAVSIALVKGQTTKGQS